MSKLHQVIVRKLMWKQTGESHGAFSRVPGRHNEALPETSGRRKTTYSSSPGELYLRHMRKDRPFHSLGELSLAEYPVLCCP